MNLEPLPMVGGWEGEGLEVDVSFGRRGERQMAWVMLVQSKGIMFAVWMMTWAASSWRMRINIFV